MSEIREALDQIAVVEKLMSLKWGGILQSIQSLNDHIKQQYFSDNEIAKEKIDAIIKPLSEKYLPNFEFEIDGLQEAIAERRAQVPPSSRGSDIITF